MKKAFASLMVFAVVAWACPAFAGHSSRGCHNCHVPHHAGTEAASAGSYGVPLWSTMYNTGAYTLPTNFTLYSSKSFDALGTDIGQPDGASKLCLGCHDGAYDHVSGGDADFGTDLSTMHPISFTYDSALAGKTKIAGELNNPTVALSGFGGTIDQDLLDIKHKLQCVTCHDVHATGKGANMLRWDYNYDSLLGPKTDKNMCIVCHNK